MINSRMITSISHNTKFDKFVIVGAGKVGKELLHCLLSLQKEVIAVFDNDIEKIGKVIEGVVVEKPYKVDETCLYILAVNDRRQQACLKDQMLSLGIDAEVLTICDRSMEYKYWSSLKPEQYQAEIDSLYYETFNRKMDWENPKSYNEIINWEKINAEDMELKTRLSDKFLVREWVANKIGEEFVPKLLGVWDDPSEIDFSKLPDSFVLKMNNASGRNILVKNKNDVNKDEIIEQLNIWLERNFGYQSLAFQYKDIVPKIICEEYLEGLAETALDYDVYCFHGEPKYIWCIKGSHRDQTWTAFYDTEWKRQNFTYGYPGGLNDIPRPEQLDEILEYSKILSKGFRHVRVDWYILEDGRVLFSEMTFATWGGLKHFDPEEWDYTFGRLITENE